MHPGPPGYAEVLSWSLGENWRRMLVANLIGLLSLPVVFLLVALSGTVLRHTAFIITLADGDGASRPMAYLSFASAVVAAIVLHEVTHGLAIRAFGKRPTFGFSWRAWGGRQV